MPSLKMSKKYEPTSPNSSPLSISSAISPLKTSSSSSSSSVSSVLNQKSSAFASVNQKSKQFSSSSNNSSSSNKSKKGIKRSYLTTENADQHKYHNKYMKPNTSNENIKQEQRVSDGVIPLSSENTSENDSVTFKTELFKNRQSLLNKSLDWKITFLDGTQTVELNMADDLGKPKKTHVCLFCGKIYNRKYGLKIHLRTHTGYKPLKCKVCSRPFSDPSNLNKHVRLHSQGETPYRCPYCGKVLVRKRDLDRHIMSRHNTSLNDGSNNNDNNNISGNNGQENDHEDEIDVDGDDDSI